MYYLILEFCVVVTMGFIRMYLVFPGGASGKESACQCKRCKRWGFNPGVRKIPWNMKCQPTPLFLLGKSQGQRSLESLQSTGLQRVGQDWVTKNTHIPAGMVFETHQDFGSSGAGGAHWWVRLDTSMAGFSVQGSQGWCRLTGESVWSHDI